MTKARNPKTRRRCYPAGYQQKFVNDYRSSEQTLVSFANDRGVSPASAYKWVSKANKVERQAMEKLGTIAAAASDARYEPIEKSLNGKGSTLTDMPARWLGFSKGSKTPIEAKDASAPDDETHRMCAYKLAVAEGYRHKADELAELLRISRAEVASMRQLLSVAWSEGNALPLSV